MEWYLQGFLSIEKITELIIPFEIVDHETFRQLYDRLEHVEYHTLVAIK